MCVKDEWKCLLLLYIIISVFCLSKCKTNVVTKLIFENSCHTLVRWLCKGIYKILTIGKKKKIVFIRKVAETFYMKKKSINQSTSLYKSTSLKQRSTSRQTCPSTCTHCPDLPEKNPRSFSLLSEHVDYYNTTDVSIFKKTPSYIWLITHLLLLWSHFFQEWDQIHV